MKPLKLTLVSLGFLGTVMGVAAKDIGPIRTGTEVFQEVSIEDIAKAPDSVTTLQSIQMEPQGNNAVSYTIHFHMNAKDTLPLKERYSYQDLLKMHIFDFYNCYSTGAIDGIAIRQEPVSSVDKKMYKSKAGTFVLRVIFTCGENTKANLLVGDSTLTVTFSRNVKVMAPVAKKELFAEPSKPTFVQVHKRTLYGIGITAIAGAAATYLYGMNRGIDAGRNEEFSNPRVRLPSMPTQEEAFPPAP
jgi:hypothetical protein